MLKVNSEKQAQYRATLQKRTVQQQQQLTQQYERAWHVARQAASFLKEQYAVTQVVVFGSLVDSALFHARSDIDLAVWGLAERQYYRAVGELQALDSAFAIDLIRLEDAPLPLRAVIEQTGHLV
jgi:predicted nucleotidyltransferase